MSAAGGTYGAPVVKDADPLKQSGRGVLTVLMYVAAAVGLGLGLFFSIREGGLDGAGLSFLYALIPVPVLVAVYLWLDGYEPEPRRYLMAAFVWGAVGAVAIALLVQILADRIWDPSRATSATYIAPITEEPAKGVILVLTLLRRRKVIDGIVDGFVYGGIAALGFAFTENVLYYTTAFVTASEVDLPGAFGATGTFFGRGVMTPFLHPLFTTWFGVALAMAILSRNAAARIAYPLIGLAMGMLVHGGWNAAASSGQPGMLLLAYGVGLVLLGGLLTWALLARRAEGRVLWESLTDMARRRGWIHVDEVPHLARLGLRGRARQYAKRTAGREAANAVRSYQQSVTQVAFLYDGVMRRRPKHRAVARVDALRSYMTALRPYVVLPPPVRIVKRLPRRARRPAWGYPPPPPNGWQTPPPPGWQVPPQQRPQVDYPPPRAPRQPPQDPRGR